MMRSLTALAALGILVAALCGTLLWHSSSPQNKYQQNAGGSATGNALEVADWDSGEASPKQILVTSPWFEQMTDPNASANGVYSHSQIPPSPLTQVMNQSWNDPANIVDWLNSKSIKFRRIIVLSPQGDNLRAKVGIEGPAFFDLSAVPNGVQAGDVILYREGTYRHLDQLPSVTLTFNSITLVAWPGERVRIAPIAPLSLKQAAQWNSVGLDWILLGNDSTRAPNL